MGLAGRALLPEGRLVDEGRTPLAGCREVPDGLTASPEGRLDVPVAPGRTVLRVPLLTPEFAVPRVTAVRVEIRPLASREIAVRVALRVDEREVRVFIRSREEERTAMCRLLTIIAPG